MNFHSKISAADTDVVESLVGGMRRAVGPAPNIEHPWSRARRLSAELSIALDACDNGNWMAHVEPSRKRAGILYSDREFYQSRFHDAKLVDAAIGKPPKGKRPLFFDRKGGDNCWWGGVKPSGDYQRDIDAGHELAVEWLKSSRTNGGLASLAWVVEAMPKDKLSGLEIGFLRGIGEAAALAFHLLQEPVLQFQTPDEGPADKVTQVAQITQRLVTAIEAEADGYIANRDVSGDKAVDAFLSDLGTKVSEIEKELQALGSDPDIVRLRSFRWAMALCERRWRIMEGDYYDPQQITPCLLVDAALAGTRLDGIRMLWHVDGEPRTTRPSDDELNALRQRAA